MSITLRAQHIEIITMASYPVDFNEGPEANGYDVWRAGMSAGC